MLQDTVVVEKGFVQGVIYAPTSKSSMQRACAASLIKRHISIVENIGVSNDDKASLKVIQDLGAKIKYLDDRRIEIDARQAFEQYNATINFGESGLGIRMFTPIAALVQGKVHIMGEGSLLLRPMSFFDTILPQLNVDITSHEGRLPIQIQGPLQPQNIEIDGSLSSQFLTGLLFSFAATNAADKTIVVNNLNSKPYIDLTLKVLADFDLPVPNNDNYKRFTFSKCSEQKEPSVTHYKVESDWSGGAFLLVAAAIAGQLKVHGLQLDSTQADKAILQALRNAGSTVDIQNDTVFIQSADLKAFEFDATDCPDLFPPLVSLATFCQGTSRIRGVHRLTHKESNRALTLQEEFHKMGVTITFDADEMLIEGRKEVEIAVVDSRNDHRIAMACAIAALRSKGRVTITHATAVNKSYPNFFEDLGKIVV